MRKRLIIVIIVIALLHAYIGIQLLKGTSPMLYIPMSILLLISMVAIPVGMSARFIIKNQRLSDNLSWIGMLDLGLFSTTLILVFIRQITLLILSFFTDLSAGIMNKSSVLVLVFAVVITLIGLINARRTAQVVKIDIGIENLPPELEGFSIAQISDIHVGPTIKRDYLKAIVNSVNKLNADLVAVTGDLVDGSVTQLSSHTEPLSDLKSKHGSFFVLGNHEYYSGADSWVTEIERIGLTVLLNEHVVIKHNGANLVIAGITDFSGAHFGARHKSNPKAAIAGAPDEAIKILLAHQPRSAIEAEKFGYALQLSGHTHGGQFWPWNLFVRLQQPFTSGLGRVNNMWVYTNRGTGYWGPPKRFGVASEITLLRLVHKIKSHIGLQDGS